MPNITGTTVPVWLTNEYTNPQDLASMEPKDAIDKLTLYHSDMSTHGWVRVGDAHITINLKEPEELLQFQLEALRTKKAEYQKEAQDKLEEYDHRIAQLLALPAPNPEQKVDLDDHFPL